MSSRMPATLANKGMALCANILETPTPLEFTVEGGEGKKKKVSGTFILDGGA